MSQAPIMPIFPDALISDTTFLSTEEFGAYCLILFATWRNNGRAFPDNDKRMARICRMDVPRWRKSIRPVMVQLFDLSDGVWRQHRLEKEWKYCAKKAAASRENGALGGRPKLLKTKDTGNPPGSSGNNLDHNLEKPTLTLTQESKKDSEAKASATAGAAPPSDPVKILWDRGVALLLDVHLPEVRARRLVGGWRREFNDAAVMAAIVACEHEEASDPVAFIAGCLQHSRKQTNGHGRLTPANERFIAGREATLRAVLAAEERDRAACAGYETGDSS